MDIFSVNGRCGRLAYFITQLVASIGSSVANEFSRGCTDEPRGFVCLLVILACVWISICMSAKRCHDIGHNGWWQLIPFYGIWLLLAEGEPNDNKYGPANK